MSDAGTSQVPAGAVWVRFPRFIGDSIMIHRAVEPLRAMGYELVGWGPGRILELFQQTPYFTATLSDPPTKASAWELSRLLRRHAPRATVNLTRSQRTSVAAWLARVPLRLGWREGMGGLFCNHALSFLDTGGHQQEKYAALLQRGFPGMPTMCSTLFQPGPAAQEEADRLLAGVDSPFVVLALGAMSWSKRLGLEVWIGLGRAILEERLEVVLLGAQGEDQERAGVIAQALPEVHDLTGRASLAVAAGVIKRASGVVGNDSALSHLAAACGVPTVAAFGPTDMAQTAPWGERVRVVRREDLPCLGCQQGACPEPGHPCMEGMRVEDLLLALQSIRLKVS
jgi:ADP-heptose:LPS heptosyltransferase